MKKETRLAQVGTEYVLGAAAILAVLVLMSAYVRNGLAGRWKGQSESVGSDQFDPKNGTFVLQSVKKGGTEMYSRMEKVPTSEGYAWYMMNYQAGGPTNVWSHNETGAAEEVIKTDATRTINKEITAKSGTTQWQGFDANQ